MLHKAELVKCHRTESIINEEFGFLDRSKGQESFLDYFKMRMNESTNKANYYCPLNMFLCRIIRFLAKDPPLKR